MWVIVILSMALFFSWLLWLGKTKIDNIKNAKNDNN